ncbi:MAG TPA: histidine phosphatase family protein [Acidimicrobiales bacterium]|nr:histidine phosphatase family protein [Acidimicrobiales bacterium]
MSTRDTKPTLWFVRHGESTWNAAGIVQGQAEGPVLTAKGRREAARVAEQLRKSRVAAIYTSDLERAHETAAIIGHALRVPLRYERALRERNFGQAEGHPLDELATAASGIEGERVVDADVRPTEGESVRDLYERVRGFIDATETGALEGDVVVVTHGGVIRVAQAYDSGIGVEAMSWGPVPNASVWSLGRPRPAAAVVQ